MRPSGGGEARRGALHSKTYTKVSVPGIVSSLLQQ